MERWHGVTVRPPNINRQPCIEISGRLVTQASIHYLDFGCSRAPFNTAYVSSMTQHSLCNAISRDPWLFGERRGRYDPSTPGLGCHVQQHARACHGSLPVSSEDQRAALYPRSSDVSAVSSPSPPATAVPPFSPSLLYLRQTKDYGKDNGPKNTIHASRTLGY